MKGFTINWHVTFVDCMRNISFIHHLKGCISSFTSIGSVVSEKKMFGIWNLSDLCPRSLN